MIYIAYSPFTSTIVYVDKTQENIHVESNLAKLTDVVVAKTYETDDYYVEIKAPKKIVTTLQQEVANQEYN